MFPHSRSQRRARRAKKCFLARRSLSISRTAAPGAVASAHFPSTKEPTMGLSSIEHIVVVMMENRSLDNLVGWLYAETDTRPPSGNFRSGPNAFDGLKPDTYFN